MIEVQIPDFINMFNMGFKFTEKAVLKHGMENLGACERIEEMLRQDGFERIDAVGQLLDYL